MSSSGTLEQLGRLVQRPQYIQRESGSDAGSLPYSAKLLSAGIEWNLRSDPGMLTAGDWYAAKVRIPAIGELENANNFKKARDLLLESMTVVSLLRDKQLEDFDVAEKNLKLHIRLLEKGMFRGDLAGVRQCVERYLYFITSDCAKRVREDPNISESLKRAIVDFADKQQPLLERNSLMKGTKGFNYDCVPFVSFLRETIDRGCKAYRNRLLAQCPILLRWNVTTASDRVVLNVSLSDLELFSKLETLLNEAQFASVLPIIITKYWTAVKGLQKGVPLTNSVYFQLLKNLLQTAEDVSSVLDGLEVISYENEWKLRSLPEGQLSQVVIRAQQLKLLVDLTNHYEPGKSTVMEKIPFELKRQSGSERTNDFYCLLQEMVEVSKTVRVDFERMYAMLSKSSVNEFHDSTEAVRFIVEMLPPMMKLLEKDAAVLRAQLNNGQPSLLEAFSIYCKQRQAFYTNLVSRLPGNYWKSKVHEVMEIYLQITTNLLVGMDPTDSGPILRVLDGILIILSELRFDWYVTQVPDDEFVKNGLIRRCDSDTSDGVRGHLVLQPDKFVEQYRLRFPDLAVPKHYEALRLKSLLSCVQILTEQLIWNQEKRILDSTVLLVANIRKILFNRHGADCSMEELYNISTEPLQSAVEDYIANPKTSFDDFRIRLERLGESFYCKAKVELFPEDSSDTNDSYDCLRDSYADEINKFVKGESNSIRTKLEFIGEMHWSQAEKLACIPTQWSRIASMDYINLCQYPSPTSVQFCSILKMLQYNDRISRLHMVDLLSDQEKFLVLGLSSAVLAYCGHQVYIAYPNRYLLERHANKFRELFEAMKVHTKISFGTYDEVMMERHDLLLARAESYMRRVMNLARNNIPDLTRFKSLTSSKVLLIDEVDAYFSEKFTSLSMNLQLIIPGLELVQTEIWRMITYGDSEKETIKYEINNFVQEDNHQKMHELRDFLRKQAKYKVYDSNELITNEELYCNHVGQMIDAAKLVHSVNPGELFRIDSSGLITVSNDLALSMRNISPYFETFAYFKLKQVNFIQNMSGGCNYGYLCIPVGTVSYGYLLKHFDLVLGVSSTTIDRSDQHRVSMKELYGLDAIFPPFDFCQPEVFKFDPTQSFTCNPTELDWRKKIFTRLEAIISQDRSAIVFFNDDCQVEAFRLVYAPQLERLNVLTVTTGRETMQRYLSDAGLPWMVTLTTRDMVRGMDYKSSVTVQENGGIHVIQGFFSLDSREEVLIQNHIARKPKRGTYELIVCFDHLKELSLIGDDQTVTDGITYDQLNEGRKHSMERMAALARRNYEMEEANKKHIETENFFCYEFA